MSTSPWLRPGRWPVRRAHPSTAAAASVLLPLLLGSLMLAVPARAGAQPLALPADPVTASAAAPHAAVPQGTGAVWGWPLQPRPAVVRPFQPPPAPWLAGHRGVDLDGPTGAVVLAAGAGVVTFVGAVAGVPVVSVDHPGGLRTTYQPVLATAHRGDDVRRGARLGSLAAVPSHCAPATCLHWGLRRGATYLDPLSLLGVDLRVRLLPVWSS